jgi:hypothetical protein
VNVTKAEGGGDVEEQARHDSLVFSIPFLEYEEEAK